MKPIYVDLPVAAVEWKLVILMLVLKPGAEDMKVHFGSYSKAVIKRLILRPAVSGCTE